MRTHAHVHQVLIKWWWFLLTRLYGIHGINPCCRGCKEKVIFKSKQRKKCTSLSKLSPSFLTTLLSGRKGRFHVCIPSLLQIDGSTRSYSRLWCDCTSGVLAAFQLQICPLSGKQLLPVNRKNI